MTAGFDLLCALVNLLQERAEDGTAENSLPTWALHLRDRIDETIDARIRLGLILRVKRVDPDFAEDLLDPRLRFRVLAAVVRVQDRSLGRARVRECSVDAPRALVVQNVCADFTNLLRRSCKVEVVVLDLEILAER